MHYQKHVKKKKLSQANHKLVNSVVQAQRGGNYLSLSCKNDAITFSFKICLLMLFYTYHTCAYRRFIIF